MYNQSQKRFFYKKSVDEKSVNDDISIMYLVDGIFCTCHIRGLTLIKSYLFPSVIFNLWGEISKRQRDTKITLNRNWGKGFGHGHGTPA